MGWNAQDIEKLRKKNDGQKSTAGSTGNSAGNSSTHSVPAPSAGGGSQSGGWSAEKIDAMRANSGVKATAKNGTDAWVNRGAGTSVRSTGNNKNSAGNSSTHSFPQGGSLEAEVLKQMNGVTGTPAKTGSSKLQLAVPQEKKAADTKAQPEWLTKPQPKKPAAQKATAPAATVRGTVKPTADQRAQARRNGNEGVYAMGAQAVSDYTEELKATDKFSDFDRLNQWMDADPKHRTLVNLIRMGKSGVEDAAALGSSTGDNAVTAQKEYTDAELMAKGYSKQQISKARQYITDFDALPEWQRAARRTSNTIGGIGYTVASAPFLTGESVVQAVKNETTTTKNWTELQQSVQGDARQRELLRLMTGGKTQYAGRNNAMQVGSSGAMAAPESTGSAYTDEELKAKGYTQSEIDRMRARISGTKVSEGIDPEKSFGYQLYHRGQQLNEAAQAGMSPAARTAMGIVTSAAENLAVAGISPALVLPVLSAQGGAESMGQSIERGDSAGKTLAGGLAKFGAGWAINSVGAADLAKTMDSDYAKNTLAGKLADVVRSVAADGRLAQQYPAIANTISGGVDNAIQAFVETYADMMIDAGLGDADAAANLYKPETFLQALESGLTGGASGALGGAVGTQLGKMRAAMETEGTQAGNELPQSPAGDSSLREGALETAEQQAAANDRGKSVPEGEALAANDRKAGNAAQQAEDAAVLQQEAAPAANEAAAEQTAVKSSNPAVQQLAEAMDSGKLTSRTIKLFTPNAANEANRAAFAEEYGVELPGTAAQTRQMLRQMEAERSTARAQAQTEQQEQDTVQQEQAGEQQGTGREIRDGVMTTWNPDGTVETQVLDPEMAARAQAERKAAQAQTAQKQTVENAGEMVEGQTVQQTEPAAMRETAGLEVRSEGAQKSSVQRELQRWKVSEGAAKTLSRNMPAGIADESRYAAAASSLYRLGQMEDVTTFDKAMELAKGMNGLAVNTEYVLAQPGGEAALKVAWLQGKGEAEAGVLQAGTPGGALSEKSTSGSGRVLYKGTMRTADEVATKLIELNARATDTDAVLKAVLEGDERVRAYVDTATGQIFFADSAGDVFGTVLHEDWHWYNALDAEGAKALQQHVLEYLAKSEGFENIDELIRAKLADYAQQNLTYGEAAEELVADAWRGIFDSEESFKRWVEFQRGQAEKNAGRAGTIRKVMNAVKDLLNDIVSRAKEVLAKDPENRAAMKAQRLAEAEKRALQEEYFAHAEKAMENLRAAKENAAALENKGAAKERRYEINPEYADDIDQWDKDGRTSTRTFILGRTGDALQSLGARENDIYMKADKINTILKEHPEMTLEEIKRIPEILDDPVMILTSQNKGRTKQNTRLVMFGDVKAQDGRPVLCVLDLRPVENHIVISDMQKVTSAYTKDVNPVEFVRKSDVLYVDENKERTTELFRTLGFKIPSELQLSGSIGRITYGNQDVKLSGVKFTELEVKAPVKKNVRMQIAEADEVEKLSAEQQALSEQQKALKEERTAWLESAEVKAVEAKKKALGNFSAQAKEYRESEEYQSYIAKRKDYNSRLAQLEEQSAALGDRMREAGERLQARANAKVNERQLAYNAEAEKHGGRAEYRRQLAKERFGVTEDFKKAGYILPDGKMLNFAQSERTRDTDHRAIREVFGPAEVKTGTEALNEFLLDGNVRVMAEGPGIDLSADTEPTAQQLEQIRKMVDELSGERGQFILDISTADGRVAASKAYSGSVDADKVVREIREYYRTGELAQESELAKFRYQLAEQAERDAKRNEQQQASRVIAEKEAALDTLSQFFGLTRGVNVSRSAVDELAGRWLKANGSKADRAKLAQETEVLVNYLKADGADMNKAEALAETLAGEIQDGATYRNSELWDEYPELHKLEYTVNKTGQAKAELVKRYGSWSEAVAEARRHGVTLRQADGVRDGNPAEQYESIINDTRATGGITDGARALWKAAAEKAGVAGALSMESTEWLDVLMNLHDDIKPKTMSRFADDAEYEDAKVELAGRIIGDIMQLPQLTDAEAIFEGIQRHNMEVAKAAAGDESRAAEVEKGLKGVQKAQSKEFNRRLAENQRTAGRNAEVQQMRQLQRQNAKAEKLLNENLETFGVDVDNVGDLNEKLTVLRESYEREMKAEVKRMKAERQQMLDEAKLWYRERMGELREENADLARQVKAEQRRADKAEYSLLVQENEIMEWEDENQRKAEAWQQKQAQRNALAAEVARQQRDEEIAIAKRVAEKRVQKARDGRKMDELKRGIRQDAAALNQMVLRPSKDKYVQPGLIDAAAQVAKLADMTILNERAVNQLTRLQGRIRQSAGSENNPNAMTEEWKQTGVDTLIQTLWDDLQTTKDAKLTKLHEQLAEAEVLPDSEKAWALQERLRKRIKETENRTYLPMTVDQMRMLKAITSSTLHVIRNANKTVSLAKAEEVSAIAEGAASEVNASKGNHPGGALDGVQNLLTKYNLDMLGGERVFRMLGGYAKNGQMEKMAQMLNDGQYRQTKITVEGEKLFANVTGKEHVKEMQNFAGPGADLVDVGLTDVKGKKAELTHAQLCSLYMHLHNTDSLNHLMNGGLVIPDAKLYNKGDIEQAYQKGQTVHLGMLTDADGTPTADSILQTVEAAMTDYDRAWCADMKEFFDNYTAKLINETSLQLVGYQRATVKNYYPIAVDKSVLATQIDGLNLDATIEGRGFLKNRVKSSQPILLEECSSVVQRSLRDTADYAGLAAPIRDVQKVLNSGVETREGLKNLKNGIIKEQWGGDAVNYIDNLLKDLQKKSRQRKSTLQWLGNLSSKYAGAVLTLNPGVALAQAASLPTAAAVLGGDTMAAVVPFVKNFSPKQRAALEAEIAEHGDVLLQWRQRGTGKGELQSIGKRETLAQKGMDKLPKALTGWINGMDEVTVAALWEGSKRYVQNHTAEFEGAEVTGSPAYWEAVNRTYQKVIEQTQPNYTVMQRAGIQRNPDGMAKALTMFTTQRFQNYGILADAVGDYKAQAERYRAESSAENKAEVQRAGQQLRRAVASQTVQTVTFALMKMGVGFVLHRWKDLQDENGDMTLKSLLKRLGELCMESFAGTGLYGSEIYGFASNAVTGNDYDVVSAANLGLVNEFAAAAGKFAYELRKDIGGMDEDEAEKHDRKLWTLAGNVVEAGLQALGVPYANGKKFVEAAAGWYGTLQDWKKNGKYGNFDSLPESATGQYDRLYNAYAGGDADEAQAAVEKLTAMGKEDEIYKQMKTRLVKYDKKVEAAAKARNAGDDETRVRLTQEIISDVYDVMGIRKNVKEDAERRTKVIDMVTGDNRDGKGSEGAINVKADALLKGDSGDMYADLSEAMDSRSAKDVQAEYDRLVKAGRTPNSLKTEITKLAKPDYLAGSDADKQQMADVLLALTDADGNALYTEKTFAQWEKNAEKAAEKEPEVDPYALLR